FRVTSEMVNGQNPMAFAYDNDDLLTAAGSLTLSHNGQNGLLTGTTLGGVTDTLTYDGFGEALTYTSTGNAGSLLGEQYTYDQLGRITQKVETVSGVPQTYGYTYDQVGRLTGVSLNSSPSASYTYDANGNRLTGRSEE